MPGSRGSSTARPIPRPAPAARWSICSAKRASITTRRWRAACAPSNAHACSPTSSPCGGETAALPIDAMNGRSLAIGLYAPAGFAVEPESVERAVANLEAMGHRVIVDPTCRTRWQRFSAPDDERLAAVTRMAQHPEVELVVALRGGYGWSRLLDRIDFGAVA